MLGGGALFFALSPPRAVLGDVNSELINFYRVLRRRPLVFLHQLSRLEPSADLYAKIRHARPETPIERAVAFFYLIRLSWNGLYRVNRFGQFNVPFGKRSPKELLTRELALSAARALRGAELESGDFEDVVRDARRGDFVYFDPPYPRGAAGGSGFARYSKEIFRIEDHMRLGATAAILAERGVHVLVTEAGRRELLDCFPRTFSRTLVRTPSLIAARGTKRRDAYEAVLTSYPI